MISEQAGAPFPDAVILLVPSGYAMCIGLSIPGIQ